MKKLLLYIAGVLFIAIATDLVAGKNAFRNNCR